MYTEDETLQKLLDAKKLIGQATEKFSTEGVNRVAQKLKEDGRPILAEALCDLAKERDGLEQRIKDALEILDLMKRELPKTIGKAQLDIIYDDVCQAINKLRPE